MLAIIRAMGARVRALALFVSAMFVLVAAPVAEAQNFSQEVNGRTTVRLRDVPAVNSALNAVGLSNSLGNLELASVTATDSTIAGYLNFIAMRWNFLFFKSGTSSYFALEPVNAQGQPRTPKLSDFLNVPGIQVTDMLTFDRVAMVVAARTVTLAEADLPQAAKDMFGPYFQNRLANVELSQGVTYFGMADLGKLEPLRQAITAIGGQSTQLLFKASLTAGFLDAITKNEKPSVTARFEALLPTFRPRIGIPSRYIEIPADFTFGLVAELTPPDVKFGYIGEAEVPFAYPNIAKKRIDTARTTMALAVNMGLEGGVPTFGVSGTMFKGAQGAFKQAFGLPFIDLQDYTMEFEQSADSISVGIGAGGRFYNKNIETFASVQVRASSSGFPIPKQLKFMVTPVNPNDTAYLALTDLTNAFSDLTAAVTGASIPKVPLPEDFVQIKGAKAGEGPFIDVTLDVGLDAGLEMGGALNVFGMELARVDTAVIKPTQGIEIKARTNADLPIDIIKLPQADVDIAITKDNITDPHVRIRAETVPVMGSSGAFELSIDKTRQVAVIEGTSPWNLFTASLVLDSSTKNLRAPSFDVTGIIEGNFFNRLADGLQAATADLVKGTEAVVSGMNKEVHDFSQQLQQAKIDKSKAVNDLEAARRSAYSAFESAKREVDKLQGAYNSEAGDCDGWPWNWHHCVAAGGIWTALQTAKGVLSVAQRVVDGFLAGTGAALSAVIDGLNKSIAAFGVAIDKATGALGTAIVQFTKVLDVGAKLAGKALDAIANIFDIEKLWVKGKLAILQGQQKGSLGVEYTLLGKQYLQDVSWDFKIPVDQIVEIFKPGSKPSKGGAANPVVVAAGYSFQPSSTDVARNVSTYLMNNAVLKAVSVPFDPQMCVNNPYILDQQLAEIKGEADRLNRMKRNADIYKWVQAIEASPALMSGGSANLAWRAGSGGSVPAGAISGGSESGRPNLYVCRAGYNNGTHPGKIVAQNCNIGWGGKEITLRSYEVLTGNASGVRWVAARNGQVPAGAVSGGSEPGRPNLYVCRASYNNGVHPGKIVANNCNIGWGGREITLNSYEVMVQGGGAPTELNASNPLKGIQDALNKITGQLAKPALISAYKAGKTSNAQPDSVQKFNDQASILKAITDGLKAIPANDTARQQVEANYNRPVNVSGVLDLKFLTDRHNEAVVLIAQMEKLQKDPASPCGKAIQQANVTPVKGPAPRGLPAVFGTSAFAKAAVDASQMLVTAQKKAAADQAAALRRAQLVGFADKLKQREAAAKAAAAQAQTLRQVADTIKPAPLVLKQPEAQQIVAASQAAAAKIQQAAKAAVKVPTPRSALPAAGSPQARAATAARPAPTVVNLPGNNLRPQTRQAFAAAHTLGVQKLSQAGIAAAQQNEQRLAQLRASLIAKRQAEMARRIAGIQGVDAAQKEAFAKAFSEARAEARARLIKEVPVSRLSNVPGTPFATQEANSKQVTPSRAPDLVQVNANILNSMRTNLK